MKTITITWRPPSYIPYTVLSTVFPGTQWAARITDPRVNSFLVDSRYRLTDDWQRVGETTSSSIDIPIEDAKEFQARIQTVLANGDKTGFATTGLRPIMGMEALFGGSTNTLFLAIV